MKKAAIGIDIGGTFTKYGVVDRDGVNLAEGSLRTTDYPAIEDFINTLKSEVNQLIASIPEKPDIIGAGVGAPNGNYYSGTIEYAPNLKWKGVVPFVDLFEKMTGYSTVLTNDANAAAIGEMIYGNARMMTNFIVITLGTGLGSGLVVNGGLVNGHDGFAGELGHVTVDYNGRMCGCGRRGCLETYVSATGIRRTVFELMATMTEESELRDVPFRELTSKRISEAAQRKDPVALESFHVTGKYLGYKLADAAAYLSPEAIFILGGLAKAGDLIFKPTQKYFEEHVMKVYKNKIKIEPSGMSKMNAAISGASALAWKEFENN